MEVEITALLLDVKQRVCMYVCVCVCVCDPRRCPKRLDILLFDVVGTSDSKRKKKYVLGQQNIAFILYKNIITVANTGNTELRITRRDVQICKPA